MNEQPLRRARDNPFRVSRVHSLRYRLDDPDWQILLDRLARHSYRAALVGPKGSGKTTLLEELEQRIEARGWRIAPVRLSRERRRPTNEEWRRLSDAGPRHLVTVDGVEQLSWWNWRGLSRRCCGAGGLIVTSHTPGRLPTLRQHRTNSGLLVELVAELLTPTQASQLRPHLDQLFEHHQGNLRDCLRSLYDAWARGEHEGALATRDDTVNAVDTSRSAA